MRKKKKLLLCDWGSFFSFGGSRVRERGSERNYGVDSATKRMSSSYTCFLWIFFVFQLG